MSHADDVFIRNFLVVLAGLALFAVIAAVIGRTIGEESTQNSQMGPKDTMARIQPIGKVRIGNPAEVVQAAAPATTVAAVEPSATAQSGEQIYGGACVACHAAGIAGAPKLGDTAAWQPRLGQGLAGLVASVVNGKNAMPPKGGAPTLTEEAITKAVEYMLAETGVSAN